MSTAAMAAMPAEKAGIASGVLAMDRVLAGAVGLAVSGAVFAARLERTAGGAFSDALAGSTWVLVGLLALGAASPGPTSATPARPGRLTSARPEQLHQHHRKFHLP